MRILLRCHSVNSLSQQLFAALKVGGHSLSVELDISDSVTGEACVLFQPDGLIAPLAGAWKKSFEMGGAK